MNDELPDVKLMINRLRNIDRQTMHRLGNYDGLMREAADIIERLSAPEPGMEVLLRRAQEELRLIRMKDTGAVYDVTLRVEMGAALQAAERVKGMSEEVVVREEEQNELIVWLEHRIGYTASMGQPEHSDRYKRYAEIAKHIVTALRAALARGAELAATLTHTRGVLVDQQETSRKLADNVEAYSADAVRLREALRRHVIDSVVPRHCSECRTSWWIGQSESHAPGCLAAPSTKPLDASG